MSFIPRSGHSQTFPQSYVLKQDIGIFWICKGEVLAQSAEERLILSVGTFWGLQWPQHSFHLEALSEIQLKIWSPNEFELASGQEIELAIGALISLSQQQRQLNRLLPESSLTANETHESKLFNVTTSAPGFGLQTQQQLYQLAFAGTTGISVDLLARFGRLYEPDEFLCLEGEAGQELFLLLRGRVAVSRSGIVLGEMGEGEIMGEMAVLEGHPRSASLQALGEVQVLALSREHFAMIFQLHPSWTGLLLRNLAQRVSDTWDLFSGT